MNSKIVTGNRTAEDILREYHKKQQEEKTKPKAARKPIVGPTPTISPSNVQSADKYIILEGRSHGSYSYPDLVVSTERSHHNLDWFNTHKALHQEDSLMLTVRQYVDLLKLLKSGVAYDGNGNRIDERKLIEILDDIYGVRNPYRAEWLDADFKVNDSDKSLIINYNHRTVNGKLQPQNSEILEDYLTTNKLPGIDLEQWIVSATMHGLPPRKIKKGELWYYAPMKDNNSVAGFGADSVGAFLGCIGGPSDSGSWLGVRRAKIKT